MINIGSFLDGKPADSYIFTTAEQLKEGISLEREQFKKAVKRWLNHKTYEIGFQVINRQIAGQHKRHYVL